MSREARTLGGHPIEKGARVVVAIRTLHRNEKLWPDSLGFDPDQPDIPRGRDTACRSSSRRPESRR